MPEDTKVAVDLTGRSLEQDQVIYCPLVVD